MKENIGNEYIRRVNLNYKSNINAGNFVSGLNAWAIGVIRYSGVITELDKIIREIKNQVHVKYSLQMNARLYLPTQGRGLKNLEMIYKKIKAPINLLTTSDPRIKCVKLFDMDRMNKRK